METILEQLPDEILLIICQYLSQYEIIQAFFNLNSRLNCTISQFCNSLVVQSQSCELLSIIGSYLQSLTIKNINLTSTEISLASNIYELTLIHTEVQSLPPLANLTDLNITNQLSFPSIVDLCEKNNNNIHSLYISSMNPLTIPTVCRSTFSTIKQLAITLQSLDDFIHLISLCPELTCLNLHLQKINTTSIQKLNNHSSINAPSTLRIFSLRTPYDVNLNFDEIQNIFKYLPLELEHLAIEFYTQQVTCADGQLWENYLKENFSELNRFEFFIFLRPDDSIPTITLRLSDILKTFQSTYWSLITPQQVTGYYYQAYHGKSISIHTDIIPTVGRRRYFLN